METIIFPLFLQDNMQAAYLFHGGAGKVQALEGGLEKVGPDKSPGDGRSH